MSIHFHCFNPRKWASAPVCGSNKTTISANLPVISGLGALAARGYFIVMGRDVHQFPILQSSHGPKLLRLLDSFRQTLLDKIQMFVREG